MSSANLLKEYNSLPEDYREEVKDFIGFLKKKLAEKKHKVSKRKLGFAKGKAWMAPDFDAPLQDMKKYM